MSNKVPLYAHFFKTKYSLKWEFSREMRVFRNTPNYKSRKVCYQYIQNKQCNYTLSMHAVAKFSNTMQQFWIYLQFIESNHQNIYILDPYTIKWNLYTVLNCLSSINISIIYVNKYQVRNLFLSFINAFHISSLLLYLLSFFFYWWSISNLFIERKRF